MPAEKKDHKPSLILTIIQNRCPRCRRGKLYKHNNPYKLGSFMQMHSNCTVCGQTFDMEPGFYYGTGFVSYGLAVGFSVLSLIIWWLTIGLSLGDDRFFWWMGVNAVLLVLIQPPLMRLSRSMWLSIFVSYSPDWEKGDVIKPERVNKEQMNNW